MSYETVLADTVRTRALEVTDNPGMAEQAVAIALSACAGGASASEAYREARRFVGSWSNHPSHGAAIRRMRESLAS